MRRIFLNALPLMQFTGLIGTIWVLTSLILSPAFAQVIFQDDFKIKPGSSFSDCADCPEMVVIPGGSFTMGSPPDELESLDRERPQHEVSLSAFAIARYEVTFEEWEACVADGGCNQNPDDEGWGRDDHPIINISWDDAQNYVDWLSAKTGYDYRLPSESEWEYATRAGTSGRFNTGNCITSDEANFYGTSPAENCSEGEYRGSTSPIGSFSPNAFGLYETHGNVREWVQDCWNDNYSNAPVDGSAWMKGDCNRAVVRGGGFNNPGSMIRSAYRGWAFRYTENSSKGFRVARSVTL